MHCCPLAVISAGEPRCYNGRDIARGKFVKAFSIHLSRPRRASNKQVKRIVPCQSAYHLHFSFIHSPFINGQIFSSFGMTPSLLSFRYVWILARGPVPLFAKKASLTGSSAISSSICLRVFPSSIIVPRVRLSSNSRGRSMEILTFL